MDLPKSAKEARELGLNRFYPGFPCKYGHTSAKRTSDCYCLECARLKSVEYRKRNPSAQKTYIQKVKSDPQRRWKMEERCKAHSERNKDRITETKRRWYDKNKNQARAAAALNDIKRLKRAPPWLSKKDKEDITSFYALAKEMEISTGIPHVVDHIVPLQGKQVSGLHVPWNLQVLTREENRHKSNSFLPFYILISENT